MPKTKNDSRPDDYTVRLLRVETWLARAKKAFTLDDGQSKSARESSDPDVAFLLYWIAFNAAYARDLSPKNRDALTGMKCYVEDLLDADRDNAIRHSIWNDCRDHIYTVVDNRYLFKKYWDYANAESVKVAWKQGFNDDKSVVRNALRDNRYEHILTILCIVFKRLYMLRNQLVHGGAQFESHYNRDSVFDGAHIMTALVPVFLDIMRASHGMKWGRPFFRPALKGHNEPSIIRHPLYRDEHHGS